MSYRLNLELIIDTKTAYLVKEFKINVVKACIEGILLEIERQQSVSKVTEVRNVDAEIEDLKRALTSMRQQRDSALQAVQPKKKVGLLNRFI